MTRASKPPIFSLINWPVFAIKTGLSTGLAFVFVELARVHDPISATFVAAVCTSPTVVTGVKRAIEQMVGSVLGGAIAFALLMAFHALPGSFCSITGLNGAWVLGLSVGLSVLASGLFRLRQAHIVAAFSALYMVLMVEMGLNTPMQNITMRLAAVAFGGLAAMLVNLLITSFVYQGVFLRRIRLVQEMVAWALEEIGAGGPLGLLDDPLGLLSELRVELGDVSHEPKFWQPAGAIERYQHASEALYEIVLLARCAGDRVESFGLASRFLRGQVIELAGDDLFTQKLRQWPVLMETASR